MLKKIFTFLIICGFALSVDGANKKFTVVIDAGHGGNDTGACGHISKEKNLTLRYALAFGKILEQNCPDVSVIYTRKTDRYLKLWERAEIANKNKADLFVSVHINSLPSGSKAVRGYQTYTLGRSRRDGNSQGFIENLEVAKRENSVILYEKDYQQHYEGFDPNSPESNILFEILQDKNMESSISLAKALQRNICAATGRQNKGVHQDNLAVLRLTSMPGCLMELGFISTSDEEQFLNTDAAVAQYARGFYNAFIAYKKQVAPGIPYKPIPANEPSSGTATAAPAAKPSQTAQQPTQPAQQPAPQETAEPEAAKPAASVPSASAPVFKVQILASDVRLKAGSPLLKGRKDADCYEENKMYKYTVGASADYNEIYQLRKTLLDKFPEAFIIAFKDGTKVNVSAAIREFKANKNKH